MSKEKDIHKILFADLAFPSLLKEISNPPSVLHFLGVMPDDRIPRLAIVGTRKASPNGCLIAKTLAKELTEAGCIIVSGLAMGIDTAAHGGAIAVGGKTVAVLGNGLDEIYPHCNQQLAEDILKLNGTLISEYPDAEPSYPAHFLERNRIISGLCLAVIIVEAPERSGALATARFALEQNREIFVVPGPANSFNYIGSHRLLREGARLAVSAKEVLEDLNLQLAPPSENFSSEENLILEILRSHQEGLAIDKIMELVKINSAIVNQTVAFLIVKGVVKEDGGQYKIN